MLCLLLAAATDWRTVGQGYNLVNSLSAAGFEATVAPVTTVSAASFDATALAPGAIVAAFGDRLATTTTVATDADPNTPGIQLPNTLAGTTVEVNGRRAGLFFVSPGQINYAIPEATEVGTANVVVRSGDGTVSTGTAQVRAVAPAIFTANSNGQGAPAATLLRVKANGAQVYEPLAHFDALLNRFIPKPINLGPVGERVFLILYLSGLRRAADPNNDGNLNETVRLMVSGMEIIPTYAGRQPGFVGLDQLNAELPRSLIGRGVLDAAVTVTGASPSKAIQIEMGAAAGSFPLPRAFDGFKTMDEDKQVAIELTGQDPGGRPLRYVVTSRPAHGSLSGTAPGVVYTPAANYNGEDGFKFKVNNGVDDSSEGTIHLRIQPVNDAPVLTVSDAQSANAGQTVSFTISATDIDQGQKLYITAPALPGGATLTTLTATSSQFNWIPTFLQEKKYEVKFVVTDDGVPPMSTEKAVTINVTAKWARTSGPETSGEISALITKDSYVIAGTWGGGVYTSTNNGHTWAGSNEGLGSAHINTLAAIGNNVYAGTESGIYRSSDNGQSWVSLNGNLPPETAVDAITKSGDKLSICTYHRLSDYRDRINTVDYISSDDGRTWRGKRGGSYTLTWGKLPTRTLITFGARIFKLDFDDSLVGSSGHLRSIYVCENGLVDSEPKRLLPAMDSLVLHGNTLYAGAATHSGAADGSKNSLFFSTNNGQSWTGISPDLPRGVEALLFSGNTIHAGISYYGIYRSVNNGQTWVALSSGIPVNTRMRSLALNNAGVYAAAEGGIYRSLDSGQTWSPSSSGLVNGIVSAIAAIGSNIVATTDRGAFSSANNGQSGVFRSVNNGQSWAQINPFGAADKKIKDAAANSKTFFAITDNGDLYRSEGNGQSWGLANAGLPRTPVHKLSVSGSSLFINAGDGAYLSTDEGQTWRQVLSGLNNNSLVAVNNNSLAVIINTYSDSFNSPIKVQASADNGRTWREAEVFRGFGYNWGLAAALAVLGESAVVGVTLLSDGPPYGSFIFAGSRRINLPDRHFVNDMVVSDSKVFIATGGGVYLLNATGLTEINTSLVNRQAQSIAVTGTSLVVGSSGGGVNLLTGNVQAWDAINTGLTAKSVNALVTNGGPLIAGTSDGGVFRSANQGQSWSAINNGLPASARIQSITFSGASLWAATYGDGVYRSINNGDSWTRAIAGLTNFFVNDLISSGGATLFAATDGGVFRSADGGGRWESANTGLTNLLVRSLLTSGGRLYAATEGGGVFVSSDGGQSWSQLNAGLTTLNVRSLGLIGTTLLDSGENSPK